MSTKKLGRPTRGVTEPLNIKIDPELLKTIRQLVEIRQQTLRTVVEELLRAGLRG